MVSGLFLFFIALSLLMLPFRWICAAAVAMFMHELCHYGMARLLGGNVVRFNFGIHGARMEVDGLNIWQEALCAFAGPVGGISLVFLYRVFPRIALCACFQSVFNLLPVYPLDGGRVIRCIITAFGGCIWTERICHWIEKGVLILLCFLGVYGSIVLRLGWIPLFGAILMILRAKRPCKVLSVPLQ